MRRFKHIKDKIPTNSKDEYHGYHEWYDGDDIWVRVVMKNGLDIGYEENHWERVTIFHIK